MTACARCATTASAPGTRLPRGWKAIGGDALCSNCLRTGYVQRAVTLPVASPIDHTWAEFGAVLRAQWAATTRAANWLVTTLYARDVRREPADTKLRPMPRVYLYPEARAIAAAISPIHLTALIQSVERTYRAQRYELLWTGARSLATFRYPVPLPLHPQAWRLERPEGGATVLHVRLGEAWWALRLRGGAEFQRQQTQIAQLLSGAAQGGTGALLRIAAQPGDHRGGPGRSRVLVKLVGHFPRPLIAAGTATLALATADSDLLVARVSGRGIVWLCHADQVRRAIAAYEVRRGRLAADLGVVRRWIPVERQRLRAELAQIGVRHRRAMRTWLQQIAATVVRVARREHCARIAYDDSSDGFQRPFPWTALRLALQSSCEGAGLTWEYASGSTADAPEALAVEEVS